jgi:hypothetical protein
VERCGELCVAGQKASPSFLKCWDAFSGAPTPVCWVMKVRYYLVKLLIDLWVLFSHISICVYNIAFCYVLYLFCAYINWCLPCVYAHWCLFIDIILFNNCSYICLFVIKNVTLNIICSVYFYYNV